MESKEFSTIRRYLGKTQNQLAPLLCVSPKAIQSFEQAWRRIPARIEQQMLFLLSLKKLSFDTVISPCWEITNCPNDWRENCIVWELQASRFCWFLNGTACQGRVQESYKKKLEICRECEVYLSMIP